MDDTRHRIGRLTIADRHDFCQRNLAGWLDQLVSARRTSRAAHDSGRFQLQQDLDEESRRNAIGFRDIANANRFSLTIAGSKFQDGDAGLFSLGRDIHEASLSIVLRVQTALSLLKAAPPPCPFVLAEQHGACAGPATDTCIALVV